MKTKKPGPGEIEALIADRVINQIIILQEEGGRNENHNTR